MILFFCVVWSYMNAKIPWRIYTFSNYRYEFSQHTPQSYSSVLGICRMEKAWFKWELYDFFASPTRERLTYFIEIFGHIWNIIQDLTTSWKLWERLKDGSYFIWLPDNGGIYSTQQHNYIALEVRMHDCIGYSHICTIEIPNKAHMNFIRSLTEDMRKMGWK